MCNGNCRQGRDCDCGIRPAIGIRNGLLLVAPFWIAVIAIVMLSGCTAIGHQAPPSDWPTLTVNVRDVGFWEGNRICGNDVPLLVQYSGCAYVDFDKMVCNVYLMVTGESRDLTLEHELDHCAGRDHMGSSELADSWGEWKRNNRRVGK